MRLALIYARSRNRCIGKDGGLPWDLPDEYAFFERTTRGNPVIMGRRTFEDHEGVLEARRNILVSSTVADDVPGADVARSLDDAIAIAEGDPSDIAFVIGGAGLLSRALPQADLVYESVIDADIDGDVFVPDFEFSSWDTDVLVRHPPDARHAFGFEIFCHRRRQANKKRRPG